MDKICYIFLISSLLSGCMSLSTSDDKLVTKNDVNKAHTFDRFNHNIQSKDLPTGIFTYYDDPKAIVPAVDVILYGRFVIENDCLLFKSGNILSTPIFPLLYTRYKKNDTKIRLNDIDINIGEDLEIHAFPGIRLGTEKFVTKGSDSCLMENISKIQFFTYDKSRN